MWIWKWFNLQRKVNYFILSINALDLNKDKIYEEIEIEIYNSPLLEAFLFEY